MMDKLLRLIYSSKRHSRIGSNAVREPVNGANRYLPFVRITVLSRGRERLMRFGEYRFTWQLASCRV